MVSIILDGNQHEQFDEENGALVKPRRSSQLCKGMLAVVLSVFGCVWTAWSELPFAEQSSGNGTVYDVQIVDENVVLTVPAGFATGKSLVVAWDVADRGGQLAKWPNRQVLTTSIPVGGIGFSCPLSAVIAEGAQAVRAFTADELVCLERLQLSNNRCYVNTGIKDSACSRVAFSFYQTGQSGSWGGVIGCSGEDSFAVGMNNGAANSWCWWYGRSGKRGDRPTVYTDRPNIVDFNEGVFNLNGSAFASNLGVPVGEKGRDIYVGTSTIIPSRQAYGWWYYVRLWGLEGEPLLDYVPAKRGFDGTVGFYDRVSGNFVLSSGGGAFTAGTETEMREYLGVLASSPVLLDPNIVQTAVWTGAGDPADLFASANWTCTNFYGEELVDTVPSNGISVVTISGTVAFDCVPGQQLPWKTATFGNCTLAQSVDWTGLGAYTAWLAEGAQVDLAGHSLRVEAPVARESTVVTFTNRVADEGELHLVLPSGYAALPQLALNGNLKLVKEGAGAFYLAREDFTGGTVLAQGVLGKPVAPQTAGAEPTFELVGETNVVKMCVPPGWHTGEALFLVSDTSVKGGDPFAWSVRHLVVSALPALGATFEFEPSSLGIPLDRPIYLLTASELGLTDRLKMTSSQTWIDTGINDKQCTRIEFAFYQNGGNTGGSWGGGVIGSLDERSFAISMSNGSRTQWCWWYKGAKRGDRPTVSETSPNVVDFDNGTFFINGQQWATGLGTPVGTNNSRLYIGRASYPDRYCFGWWYYVRFSNGGTKLIDYVPVRRESDGRACFYDRVSQRQIFSSGSGEFTPGTVTNRFYVAGQIDQPLMLGASSVAMADWTGAGDPADLVDARNWVCRNLYGAVVPDAIPNRTYTQATIQNEVNFECPPESVEPWLRLHVGNCLLTRAHDWRGAKTLQIDGTLNLSGQTLAVSVLAGGGTVTGSGQLRMEVPQGVTQVNTSLEVGGAVQLVKEGAGTYQPKVAQTYTGGTVVKAGTLSFPAVGGTTYSPYNGIALLGPAGATITVETGATFDTGGNYDISTYRTILNGGTYANLGRSQDNYATWGCNGNITLTTNSFMRMTANTGLTSGTLDLGGHTLTVNVPGGVHFYLRNGCQIKDGKMVLVPSAGMFCLYTDEVIAPTLDLDLACNTEIKKPLTVRDYTMRRETSWSWSSALTKVYGRFQPLTDHFTCVELQAGAVLDLTTRTSVWSTRGVDVNNQDNGGVFPYVCTFAEGATITVDLSGRRFESGEQVVSWEGELANWDSLTFKIDRASRQRYALQKKKDGLFVVSSSFVLYLR